MTHISPFSTPAVIAFYINLRRRKSQVAKTERALTPDEKRRAEALLRGDK